MENDNIEKIERILGNLKNNNIRYYFLMPEIETPNSTVYEIYRHAKTLKESGFNVTILTEEFNYKKPEWIDDTTLTDVEHKQMGSDVKISPEDCIIIPEIFTNVMEKIRNLQCHKVLLFQSFDYALHSLLPGVDYYTWGIFDVITPSESSKDYFKLFFGDGYNVVNYNIGIPDYFKYENEIKKPIISFITRNSVDINRINKLFYLKFPFLRFVTFQDLSNLNKKEFANKLKESFALLWIDNISTASTIPLEAMKANTITIGTLPSIKHDYINEKNGYWTDNKYEIPLIIGKAVSQYLEDEFDETIFDEMNKTVENYTDSISGKQIKDIYDNFLNKRIVEYENYLNNIKEEK